MFSDDFFTGICTNFRPTLQGVGGWEGEGWGGEGGSKTALAVVSYNIPNCLQLVLAMQLGRGDITLVMEATSVYFRGEISLPKFSDSPSKMLRHVINYTLNTNILPSKFACSLPILVP